MFKVNDDVIANDDVPNNEPVNPNVDVVEPVTIKLPVIIADPVNGKAGPAVALIVTDPFPPVGDMVILVPATI